MPKVSGIGRKKKKKKVTTEVTAEGGAAAVGEVPDAEAQSTKRMVWATSWPRHLTQALNSHSHWQGPLRV